MTRVVSEEIPEALDGERLDRIVSLVIEVSRADASAVIVAGGVTVDGMAALSGKVRLRAGQTVAIDPSKLPVEEPPAADHSVVVDVMHADDDVIVVDKAAGVVVHPGAGNATGTLVNGLLAAFPEIAGVGEAHRPGIVHRLDVGTTGLLIVARTARAYDALVEMMASRAVTRRYTALVWGRPAAPIGTIDAAIGRDPRDPLRMAVVASGKPARTNYRVESTFGDPEVSLVTCELETGRTHQIRVHLQATGHPVVGDPSYGGARAPLVIGRPFLHAGGLEFVHPFSGRSLAFTSPLPADLVQVLDRLRT
ncbi:MAG: RluA family pseudouridine synthase [Actinomycetota bacterium]